MVDPEPGTIVLFPGFKTAVMAAQQDNGAVLWHDEIAQRFDRAYTRSRGFAERERIWRRLIADHMPDRADVLDAGCGSGIFSLIAAERAASVTGIDGSANMIAIASAEARRRGLEHVCFRQAMLETLEQEPTGSYDVILSSSVLEYLVDYRSLVTTMGRLLRPGGTLVVSMPNAEALYRTVEAAIFALSGRPRYFAHVRNLASASQLAGDLRDAGLIANPPIYYADPPSFAGQLASLLPVRRRKTMLAMVARKPLS